jgi:hypothetical protein
MVGICVGSTTGEVVSSSARSAIAGTDADQLSSSSTAPIEHRQLARSSTSRSTFVYSSRRHIDQ